MNDPKPNEFEQAAEKASRGILGECAAFLATNRKFWMIPLLLVLLLITVLVILGATGAAPFIYTLF